MIDYLCGLLESKSTNSITVDVNGIGYIVFVPVSTFSNLPKIGNSVKIYVVEAVAGMYGGVICLYGFLTKEDRQMYLLIKDEVPSTGAKKAMEYIDKISKSFADFKAAIITKNPSMLNRVFGFTKKTADKLVVALKDKIVAVNVLGEEKWSSAKVSENTVILEAIEGLIALGCKEHQVRAAVTKIFECNKNITLADLIRKSLQDVGTT
ncbi:Holliday junction ATP-dependent DNA helicase RuvA [Endomicrobiia bacterium]|nr:Holliday junction ATP-dependent DNA helicase RuvA [Endomicrobiia bacterium]